MSEADRLLDSIENSCSTIIFNHVDDAKVKKAELMIKSIKNRRAKKYTTKELDELNRLDEKMKEEAMESFFPG